MKEMCVKVTFDREADGRWIAAVDELGVLVYGDTRKDAYGRAKAAALFALSGLAESEGRTIEDSIQFEAA
jgi:predicted RNase H-like HicB family nuclease